MTEITPDELLAAEHYTGYAFLQLYGSLVLRMRQEGRITDETIAAIEHAVLTALPGLIAKQLPTPGSRVVTQAALDKIENGLFRIRQSTGS